MGGTGLRNHEVTSPTGQNLNSFLGVGFSFLICAVKYFLVDHTRRKERNPTIRSDGPFDYSSVSMHFRFKYLQILGLRKA